MELHFVRQWEENKHKLREYFAMTKQDEYNEYAKIVKKLFELCITDTGRNYQDTFMIDKLTEIDNGNYQGTLIFFIPTDAYQPSVSDYVYTSVSYGSCSGCDTLQGIHHYSHELPNAAQVDAYMTLSLHLVQKLKWLEDVEINY